jgi:hypothetical protein
VESCAKWAIGTVKHAGGTFGASGAENMVNDLDVSVNPLKDFAA